MKMQKLKDVVTYPKPKDNNARLANGNGKANPLPNSNSSVERIKPSIKEVEVNTEALLVHFWIRTYSNFLVERIKSCIKELDVNIESSIIHF